MSQQIAPAKFVDLAALGHAAQTAGPQWGLASADLNLTLLSWPQGQGVETHINSEVDVVLLAIEGQGEVTVDGQAHALRPGQALVIPKGTARAVHAVSARFSYLSVHRCRRGLVPTLDGKPLL